MKTVLAVWLLLNVVFVLFLVAAVLGNEKKVSD
jgi:hypothetical protein